MKRFIRNTARSILSRGMAYLNKETLVRNRPSSKTGQLLLAQNYRQMVRHRDLPLPSFADVGFREYSEFEEDGILLFLFSVIPPQSRTCLEICAGNGIECNTANLIINHGWRGHLFDGDPSNVELGRDFYRRNRDTFVCPPVFSNAWITAENVNELILKSGLSGKIDLLSLDIDGMDYWVWKAISAVDPNVVVCEVNNSVPAKDALTVPYDPKFVAPDGDYRGASLRAMCNLAREKGYRLVGMHRFGFNAFFVKNGLADDLLPEVKDLESCALDPFTKQSLATRWPGMSNKPWQKV